MSEAEARRRFAWDVVRRLQEARKDGFLGGRMRPRPPARSRAGRLRRRHGRDPRGGHEHPALPGGPRRDLVRRGARAGPAARRRRGRDRHVPQRRGLRGRASARVGRLQLARAGRVAARFHDQRHVLGPRGRAADRLRRRPRGPGAPRAPRDRRPRGAVPRGQAAAAPRRADGGAVPHGDRAGHPIGDPGDGRPRSPASRPSGSRRSCGGCSSTPRGSGRWTWPSSWGSSAP